MTISSKYTVYDLMKAFNFLINIVIVHLGLLSLIDIVGLSISYSYECCLK